MVLTEQFFEIPVHFVLFFLLRVFVQSNGSQGAEAREVGQKVGLEIVCQVSVELLELVVPFEATCDSSEQR